VVLSLRLSYRFKCMFFFVYIAKKLV
jgi:hypothetical protein